MADRHLQVSIYIDIYIDIEVLRNHRSTLITFD